MPEIPVAYYYVIGICLFCAGAYWLLRKSGNPDRPIDSITGEYLDPPPKSRRQELLEARAKIERQLAILYSPVSRADAVPPPHVDYEKAELQILMDGIDEELSLLQAGPGKARRDELTQAREAILHQIEILQSPVGRGGRSAPPNVEPELARLSALLEEFDAELTELRA